MDNFKKSFIDIKNEIINIKEVIIKNLQNENKRLNDVVNQLQEKFIKRIWIQKQLSWTVSMADEITWKLMEGPNSVSYDNLESAVTNLLSKATNEHVTADDIEACHRIGKSKGNSKKTNVRFINRKHCKCALINRRKLKSFNSKSIGLPNVILYFNEDLTEYNNTSAFYGRKLKRAGLINRTAGERPIKVFNMSKLL